MKKLRLFMGVIALMLACVTAQAKKGDTFTQNKLTYKVLTENTTNSTGTVSVAPANSTLSGTITIPSTVSYNSISYSVVTVLNFSSCSITKIEIPATVTSIANGYINAKTLKEIIVDNNNTKYTAVDNVLYSKDMTQLICYPAQKPNEVFHTPETVTQINADAFKNSIIKKIYLNEGLTTIGTRSFESCFSLNWVDVPTTLTGVGSYAFQAGSNNNRCLNVNIHDLVKFCGIKFSNNQSFWMNTAFDKEHNLYINGQLITDLVIPAEVTNINTYVFHGCFGLKSVTFMGDLEEIKEGAFYTCRLEKIQFNGTCGNLRSHSFENHRLTNDLYLPEGLKVINLSAFEYDDDPYYSASGFSAPISEDRLVRVNVYIPSTVYSIGKYAFAHFPINELHIAGSGLKTIGAGAFRCYGGRLGKCKSLWLDDLENWLKVDMQFESVISSGGKYVSSENPYTWHISSPYFICGSFPMGGDENQKGKWNTILSFPNWSKNADIPRIVQFSDLYVNGQLVTNLFVPEGTKRLKRGVFAGCQSIQTVTLPNSLDTIGEYAFYQCPNIRVLKIPNSVKHIGISAFDENWAMTHVTMPSWAKAIGPNIVKNYNTDKLTEFTIPAYVEDFYGAKDLYYTPFTKMSLYFMGDSIPNRFLDPERIYRYKDANGNKSNPNVIWSDTTWITNENYNLARTNIWSGYPHYDMQNLYVKKSVYFNRYSEGLWRGHNVSYNVPVSMTNASGNPIEYKTLCRDFDVDLTHTNDNLPEGVEPLRAYLVEDVDGDLRMVFLNEIKYIPSRLKANVTDENDNLYQGVDEYVGVVLRGTPGYTYYYEIGEHDYTQGAEGQWLMDDAMAYSNSFFDGNLMAGTANDDEYVYMTNESDNRGETIVNYGLNSGKFKIYHKDGWLTYNKSYLHLPKHVSDAIESDTDADGNANLTFVFNNADGTTDKVSSVEFNRNCESDIFYNPYGQRVDANTKGIVINNGKKYVNK